MHWRLRSAYKSDQLIDRLSIVTFPESLQTALHDIFNEYLMTHDKRCSTEIMKIFTIRAVAGQCSSPEWCFASKTKVHDLDLKVTYVG